MRITDIPLSPKLQRHATLDFEADWNVQEQRSLVCRWVNEYDVDCMRIECENHRHPPEPQTPEIRDWESYN